MQRAVLAFRRCRMDCHFQPGLPAQEGARRMSNAETTAAPVRHESRTLTYVVVAGILTVLTAMEVVASYNVQALGPILVPVLIVVSGAKFALVIMFYMHLRYDSWAFSAIYLPVLLLTVGVIVYLVLLMDAFYGI